jgi:hypothetical protein
MTSTKFSANIFALLACTCFIGGQGFRILRGEDQPDLSDFHFSNYDSLIQVAATFGQSVTVPLTDETQTIIAQHGVNILLDCGPLLTGVEKPLGVGARWEVNRLSEEPDGLLVLGRSSYKVASGFRDRIETAGDLDRFLNITRSNIVAASQDADNGVYTCIVCSDIGCQSRSVTIFILGTLFQQVQGERNGEWEKEGNGWATIWL